MGIFLDPTDSTSYIITACNNEFRIKTTVTAVPSVASRWVDETLRIHGHRIDGLVVSLDIECRPRAIHGMPGVIPAALLHLCVEDRCLIFQLLYCAYIPDKLSDFLSDDRIRLVGVGIKAIVPKLQDDHGLTVSGHTDDLRELMAEQSGMWHRRLFSLHDLVQEVWGMQLNQTPISLSDWGRLELQEAQIEYVTIKAFSLYQVGRRLLPDNI